MAAISAILGGALGFIAALAGFALGGLSALQALSLWSGSGICAAVLVLLLARTARAPRLVRA